MMIAQNATVLKCLNFYSTPCAQYGHFGKLNFSCCPGWNTTWNTYQVEAVKAAIPCALNGDHYKGGIIRLVANAQPKRMGPKTTTDAADKKPKVTKQQENAGTYLRPTSSAAPA